MNHLEMKAYNEGREAFYQGKKQTDNPYPFEKGKYHLRVKWSEGLTAAREIETANEYKWWRS